MSRRVAVRSALECRVATYAIALVSVRCRSTAGIRGETIVHRCFAVLVGVMTCAFVVPSAAFAALTPRYSFPDAIAVGVLKPNVLPGANDWSCRPTAEHPRPVILVHGTGANMALTWRAVSPELKNRGYCVFALNYGGTGPSFGNAAIDRSARELGVFVDRVLAATGASKVDLVGHSQGGMMPRQYLRFEGGASKVATLLGFSPSNHGAILPLTSGITGPPWLVRLVRSLTRSTSPAWRDQTSGSPFLTRLNEGRETEVGVSYVVIQTRYDEIVTPWQSSLLQGDSVRNIVVQDGCDLNRIDHAAIVYDRRSVALALHALDPADRTPIPCTRVRQWVGG
ncbi:MAG: alpha/beta fold hydrolase [Solirubrobacteraceae bacterium]|nr:alpha/beta fold hydrolase [Solirubrobacteraceae bacterium]